MITHGTDMGPTCECGCTVWAYEYRDGGMWTAHCAGCKRKDYLLCDSDTISALRKAHCDACTPFLPK